jgi:twinkle protein
MSKIIEFTSNFTFKQHRARIAELRVGEIARPADFRDEVEIELAKGPGPHGLRWPWDARQDDFALGEGEMTVLAADGGVGKSTLTSQWALSLLSLHKVGIISVEEGTIKVVTRLIRQYAGTDEPSKEQEQQFWSDSAHDNALIYNCPNAIEPVDAYAACWAMYDQGARVVFLDNMQSCGCKTDSDQERDFINEVNAICQATGMHVVLVHHVRKTGGDADNPRPTRDRVKGNGAITQLTCNVLLLWRNHERARYRRMEEAGHGHELSLDQQQVLNEEPDLELMVSKQRFGPDHWVLPLWDGGGLTFKDSRFGPDLRLGRRSGL